MGDENTGALSASRGLILWVSSLLEAAARKVQPENPEAVERCRAESRAIERDLEARGRSVWFVDGEDRMNRCLQRHAQLWKDPELESAPSPSSEDIIHYFETGIHALGRGLMFLGRKQAELWEGMDPQLKTFLKMGAYLLFAGASEGEEDEFRSKKDGSIRGSIRFRGKQYDLVAYQDGRLSVNGQIWKVEGTKAETEAASIQVENLDYNPDSETLSLKIKGSVLFVSKSFRKQVSGDQLATLLDTLERGEGTIETPEMKSNGVRISPSGRA